MTRRSRILAATWLLATTISVPTVGSAESNGSTASAPLVRTELALQLDSIRRKYDYPALAGAVFTTDGMIEEAATGERKRGSGVAVTADDKWSLGSDSKAMTAFLVGTYVAEGKLKWSTPIASFFPEIAGKISVANRAITVGDVLSHSAGLQGDLDWFALARRGTVSEQRQEAAREALLTPKFPPGTFHYANAGYVLIAALLERMTGESWEKLMIERVFRPLHLDSAGFGRAAAPGKIDQPWPHREDGRPVAPTDFKTVQDPAFGKDELPPLLAPAGLIHCSMADWAKFLSDQLRGGAGLPALLPASVYRAMQTPVAPSIYAYGWGVIDRPWAGGKVLTHDGSDEENYCVCAVAVPKKFGVLVCTNEGGGRAQAACDEAASLLVNRYLARPSPHP